MKQSTNAPPGITQEKEKRLWQNINEFRLDDPTAPVPFSRKLAMEQKWTSDYTLGAIAEYRKFILLCCISPQGASPSKIIDEVWHLHLLYTENYWEEFCEKTLQRKLHHHPSSGGSKQKEKHRLWHLDTLEQYRSVFHQDPPPEYWLNTSPTHAIIQNSFSLRKALGCVLLIALLLVSGCNGDAATGPILLLVIVAVGMVSSALSSGEDPNGKQKDHHGNSCSSGSSCGSGCSGGCGGCGGCGS